MDLSLKERCLVATPVKHLPQVQGYLQEHENYFTVCEKATRSDLISLFRSDPTLKYLFVNPNAQGYRIEGSLIDELKLKGINTCSTGTNHIDLLACASRGVQVLSLTTDFDLINSLPSTAELAFGMLIGLLRSMTLSHHQVTVKNEWDYTKNMGRQFSGLTIGVLGYGRLGRMFVEMLTGFGVKIIVCESDADKLLPDHVDRVSIEELFEKSDAVAVHIHSTDKNRGIISKHLLDKMKRGAYLVNTARGDICDENAIAENIVNGRLGGYATDVLATEFTDITLSPIHTLAKMNSYNIIITPHVGGMTYEGQSKAFLYALKKFNLC